MKLSFLAVDGDTLGPWDFEAHGLVDDVSQRLKILLKPSAPVYAGLIWEGARLHPSQELSGTSLSDGAVLQLLWTPATPLSDYGNDGQEVLPRRRLVLPVLEASAAAGIVDVSGIYKLPESVDLKTYLTMPLKVLDICQCNLRDDAIRGLFAELPSSLEELRVSRNHVTSAALELLCGRGMRLKVLDVGYTHCDSCAPLPRVGGVPEGTLEFLGVGDLECMRNTPELMADVLSKCPNLKGLDIAHNEHAGFLQRTFECLTQHCRGIEAVYCYRANVEARVLNDFHDFLSKCPRVAHLEVSGISDVETVQRMSQLADLKYLRLEVTSSEPDMMAAVCSLRVETLYLEFSAPEDADGDDIDYTPDLMIEPEAIAPLFGKSTATCISLIVKGVDLGVLRSLGSRLHELGPQRRHSNEFSILETLLLAPRCCANLKKLSINFYEQVNPETLAAVARACPCLDSVHLNADEEGFQVAPIDLGVAALGEHCPRLETLDLYDRYLEHPAQTISAAVAGWPHLRYLCLGGTSKKGWKEADPDALIVTALAAHCPKLQTLVLYGEDDTRDWMERLGASCPLFGELNLDPDDDE